MAYKCLKTKMIQCIWIIKKNNYFKLSAYSYYLNHRLCHNYLILSISSSTQYFAITEKIVIYIRNQARIDPNRMIHYSSLATFIDMKEAMS